MTDGHARATRIGERAGERVTFYMDDVAVEACPGETIAGALLAAGRRVLRHTTKRDEPRGVYCAMGVCWECAVLVDEQSVRACVALVTPGLAVRTLRGDRR